MTEKIYEYIKKGLKKGFSKHHLKEALLKHGHKVSDVEFALAQVTGEKISKEPPKNYNLFYIGIAIVIISILIGYSMAGQRNLSLDEIQFEENEVQNYIDRIGDLSLNIEEKELELEKRILDLKQINSSVSQQEEILNSQMEKIESLYQHIKVEREEVKSLLMELINSLLRK